MAQLTLQSAWNIQVDTDEFRLVLKALGCRLKTPEDIDRARGLGDRLSQQRGAVTRQQMDQAERLLANVGGAAVDMTADPGTVP